MNFAQTVHNKISAINAHDDAELKRQLQLQQQDDRSASIFYTELAAQIQTSILAIIAGTEKIVLKRRNEIKVGTTEKMVNHANFLCHTTPSFAQAGLDFFEHFSKFVAACEFSELQQFMQNHDIKRLSILRQHDGGGRDEWFDVYAVI